MQLVELGPGRGTMMDDMLRTIDGIPEFRDALTVCLVETSLSLREQQKAKLQAHSIPVQWANNLSDVPAKPLIIIASEFFDALPIRQFVRVKAGWAERLIGYDETQDEFVFTASMPNFAFNKLIPENCRQAALGSVVEFASIATGFMTAIAHMIANNTGAGLIIDYGYRKGDIGETLQAVKDHQYHDVLTAPGEADLTAHVDFGRLAEATREAGADPYGPVEQGEFLTRIGIAARRDALIAANPALRETIQEATDRLIAPEQMGRLFKCLAVTAPDFPTPAGFE